MKNTLIILFSPLFLFSQESNYNHELIWNSNFLFESNSLDKSFLNAFLYGGHINKEQKSEWISAGNDKNIIYAEISNGLDYNYYFKKQSFGFSFYDRNIINTNFTDDLLYLIFEGNFYHQDRTLIIGETNIRADRFQQYTFIYRINTEQVNTSYSLSYLSGNHHLSYIVKEGAIYTAPLGTSLDITYNMNAFVTDTSLLNPFKNNGNGLALAFSTDFLVKDHKIQLSFSDLGFIMWNPSSIVLATDSSFNFQGIEVENIFSFNDSILEANNIEDDILRTKNESFKSYIPATLKIKISGKTKYKYLKNYTAGIIAKWQPYMDNELLSFSKIRQGFQESNFNPLYYINSIYKARYCNIIPGLRHGGYNNKTNIGLALSKGEKNKIIVGTHHLEYILNQKKSKNINIYLNIQLQL